MSIHFTYWWLLFLAIPLIGLSLIPYFKIGKKYRRTRNRIVSLVLHCLTILLVTFALSGVTIVHTVSNTANELILLVDMSNTQNEAEAADKRDNFIDDLLKESVYQNFTVGVVTFGLDQVYAVPLTGNAGSVYEEYLKAPLPDTSATDIESALEYARTLFDHPESGKIVLITDGKETDGNAVSSSAVSAITAQGTILDTVYVSSSYGESEYQILSVNAPDVQIKKNTECLIEANVLSNNEGEVRIDLYDNGYHVEIGRGDEKTDNYTVKVTTGLQTFSLPYTFTEDGMHELRVQIESVKDGAGDNMSANNVYYTYYNITAHKKVLVLEAYDGESEKLKEVLNDTEMLGEGEEYDVSVFNLRLNVVTHYIGENTEEGKIPQSVDDLREYDQIILNNISNKDLVLEPGYSETISVEHQVKRQIPLDELLYSYVYDYGGGLLTAGGKDPETDEAHAYNRRDMYRTNYEQMLPVEIINYKPSVGVFIIVDVSGSMSGGSVIDGQERIYWAKRGAEALVGALSSDEREGRVGKVGILTLGDNWNELLPLTSVSEKQKIQEGLKKILPANSGTQFLPSIRYATEQLKAAEMEKSHIIIISDCEVTQDDMAGSEEYVRNNYLDPKFNLTVSVVNIGGNTDPILTQSLVLATREEGWVIDGKEGCGYYQLTDENVSNIAHWVQADVRAPLISAVQTKKFQPVVYNALSQVVQGIDRVENNPNTLNTTLGGFFGVKKKDLSDVDLVLTGEYQVPVYARRKFGKGSVGSFMCDLKGDWSADFMNSAAGRQLIFNMIDDLMPTDDIRPQELNLSLSGKNYGNYLTCPNQLGEGEWIRGTITMPDGREVSLNETGTGEGYAVKRALNENNKYSVCEFMLTQSGIYTITLQKVNAEGTPLATASVVKEFSYSKEYDVEYEKTEEEIQALLGTLSRNGKGSSLSNESNVEEIFKEFETTLSSVFDPRLLLIVLAIALFLLDVAVRKFKFKWLHEIIRDRKQNAQDGQIRKEEQHEKDR